MRKSIVLVLTIIIAVMFAACSDNISNEAENITDELSSEAADNQELNNIINKEDVSANASSGTISLEDITSAYIEPDFKVVSSLAECYNYFELDADDNTVTETNSDGSVSLITVTDKSGNTKATMKFTYDEKIIATATYFENDGTTEKVAFSFNDENTLDIIAHVDKESKMSFYFYNEDGTFNSYVDSAGFSSLLIGSIMEGLGGVLSQ